MPQKKILALCGSTKSNSTNEQILNHIAKDFYTEISCSIFKEIEELPYFNPELDNETPPERVKQLRQQIHEADGVLICTPEYVFSLPGILKNAIEWCVSTTVFSNKPVAFIVASASGEKAFESLELILTTIETRLTPKASLLIRGAKGKMLRLNHPNEEVQDQIKQLMQGFIDIMNQENAVPTKYQS